MITKAQAKEPKSTEIANHRKKKKKKGRKGTKRKDKVYVVVPSPWYSPFTYGSPWWENSLVLPVLRKTLCHFRICKENNINNIRLFIHRKVLTDCGEKVPRGLFII